MTLAPERRSRLQELSARALVKMQLGPAAAAIGRPVPFAGGAAMVATGDDGARHVMVFANESTGLGWAVDLAAQEQADQLWFFSEHNTTAVARRAAQFRVPTTILNPGGLGPLAPGEPPATLPMPTMFATAVARMTCAGLDAEWEHQTLTGEWLGLEVARCVADPAVPSGVRFDVGVGKHDREANRILYEDAPTDEVLAKAVSVVKSLRRAGAAPHPANQLARERWLRHVLLRHPHLIGLAELNPAPVPEPRPDLRRRAVAPAWGVKHDGEEVVVVCSVGLDPDLIAQAADARCQAHGWPGLTPASPGPTAARPHGILHDLMVVVPEGDDLAITRRLAKLLHQAASVITVPDGWRQLGIRPVGEDCRA